jgi:hypothetical protein
MKLYYETLLRTGGWDENLVGKRKDCGREH